MSLKAFFPFLLALLALTGCGAVPGPREISDVQTIKIGAILPLTGPGAYVGDQAHKGLSIAVDTYNKEHTDRRVELLVEDSKSNPKDAVAAFQKLESSAAPHAYLSTLSAISMALAPQAEAHGVVLMGTITAAPELTAQGPHVFRYYTTAVQEVGKVTELLERLESKRVGLVYLNDDFGLSILHELKLTYGTRGEVVAEAFNTPDKDFSSQLTKLIAADVDTIFMAGFDSHLRNILKKTRELEFDGNMVGISTFSLPVMREDHALVEGVYAPIPLFYHPTFLSARQFIAEFETRYPEPASHYAGVAHDALRLLAAQADGAATIDRRTIFSGLQKISTYNGIFGTVVKDGQEFPFPLQSGQIRAGEIEYLE